MGIGDFDKREAGIQAAGVAVLVVLTFFLQAAFTTPRMICTIDSMGMRWGQLHGLTLLQQLDFVAFDFLFALLAGALAMAGGRLFVPWAARPVMFFGAAAVIFFYAVLTILLHGRLPAYFFPIYINLAAAIPGWFAGYAIAGAGEIRRSFNARKLAAFAGPGVLVVLAVALTPWYTPFYEAAARPVYVRSHFQPVLPPPSPGASFMPPPPESTDADDSERVFTFSSDSSTGQ
jgi:hypothetical protein